MMVDAMKEKRMKSMKARRILCTFLVLFVCVAAMAATANADTLYGDWEYRTSNGDIVITGYVGSAAKLVVPAQINGKNVVKIDDSAFADAHYLNEITFPSTVKTIGSYALSDCTNLRTVNLPSTVQKIDNYAFEDCTSLTSITLPEALENLGSNAFKNTRSLSKVIVNSKKLDNPGSNPFYNAGYDVEGGIEVVFSDTVTRIPDGLFHASASGCPNVRIVKIGKNVTDIGDSSFEDCAKLEKVIIPEDSALQEIGDYAFENCTSLTSITLPKGLETIKGYAFKDCLSLPSITLPEDLEELETQAFYNTRALSNITVKSKKLESLETRNLFYNAGYESEDGITVTFTDTVTQIPGNFFATSTNYPACVKKVTIGKNVTKIYNDAFSDLPYLKTVTFAANSKLEVIYDYAFEGCSALKKINIPKSVEKIDNYAFKDCESLATVIFAGDPPTIGNKAFENVTAKVYYPKNNSDWDSSNMSDYGGTLSWVGANFASISKQPKTAYAKYGEVAETTVKAKGDGLKYQWYIKNDGASKYSKSSVTKATYSCEMSDKSKDRRAYCVITDKYGNSVQTKTVVLRMAATITKQPKNTYTQSGSTAKVTVKAMGDELTYTWYIKNAGASKYSKSSVTKSTYSCKMSDASKDRYVYCVVEDEYGNTVKSKTVVLRMAATITKQPKSVIVEEGEKAKVTVKAVGDGLTYEWYVSDVGDTKYYLSSIDTPTYSTKMNKAKDGRKAYCVITDKYGNSVKSNTVTLSME